MELFSFFFKVYCRFRVEYLAVRVNFIIVSLCLRLFRIFFMEGFGEEREISCGFCF